MAENAGAPGAQAPGRSSLVSAGAGAPKRPRVSFTTVETRTFNKGSQDTKTLSSPEERQLSPLLDASGISEVSGVPVHVEDDTTGEVRFPSIGELCRTPDDSRTSSRRESLLTASGELGDVQRRIRQSFGPSPSPLQGAGEGGRRFSSLAAYQAAGLEPSPDESARQHSPAEELAPAAADADAADPPDADSDADGDVTAEIPGYSNLLEDDEDNNVTDEMPGFSHLVGDDEEDDLAVCGRRLSSARRSHGRPSDPSSGQLCSSPGALSEKSDCFPPEWDLYAKFKRQAGLARACGVAAGAGEDAAAGAAAGVASRSAGASPAAQAADARSPSRSRSPSGGGDAEDDGARHSGTEDVGRVAPAPQEGTVDMCGVLGAAMRHPANAQKVAAAAVEESQVREARKSWARFKPIHVSEGAPGDEPLAADSELQALSPAPPRPAPRPVARPPLGGTGIGALCGGSGLGRSPPRGGGGLLLGNVARPLASGDGGRLFGALRAKSPKKSAAAGHAEAGPEHSPLRMLPGASCFQAVPPPTQRGGAAADAGFGDGPPGGIKPMSWDDFLVRCGVAFGHPIEPPTGSLNFSLPPPPAMAPGTAAGVERASADLARRRVACLHDAVRSLSERSAQAHRELKDFLERWETSPAPPSSVAELQQALASPQDLEAFQSRVKTWQEHCKDEAWLRWYEAKQQWLAKDLAIAQEHSELLRKEKLSAQDGLRRMEEMARSAKREKQSLLHRSEMRNTDKSLEQLMWTQAQSVKEDQQLMQRKLPEVQAQLEAEKASAEQTRHKLEDTRRALEQEQAAERSAKRAWLEQKSKRIALEQSRLARTCCLKRAKATGVELEFRGGARACVTQAGGSVARVAFLPPGPPGGDPLAKLRVDLLGRAWRGALAALPSRRREAEEPRRGAAAPLEAVVPCGEVPQLMRQLDFSVLRVSDQMQALEALPKECSEVTRASARLLDDTLVITLSLVVVRSHDVLGGAEGVLPLRSPTDPRFDGGFGVDAAQCILEFRADLEAFPGSVDWSSVAVREVVGKAEAAAVGRAFHGGADARAIPQHGTLQEACAVAARTMHRAPPA